MEGIRGYLLQILASALVCGILTRLMCNKGLLMETVKLLAGVYMTISVLSPWVDISFLDLGDLTGNISVNADALTEDGKISAYQAMADIIKSQTEAYILDKANALGAEITVEVGLEGEDIPLPAKVTLYGAISPYGKSVLSNDISENLGISMEDQTWIG